MLETITRKESQRFFRKGTSTVVVGSQWGDEGKGKVVDVLAEDADAVVRFQGGNNAGHTLVYVENGVTKTLVLNFVPSGIARPKTKCYIGPGTVNEPKKLIEEINTLEEKGFSLEDRLFIDGSTYLIMPWAQAKDTGAEAAAKKEIGTTGRGIGPAYEDRANRKNALKMRDLLGTYIELNSKIRDIALRKLDDLIAYGLIDYDPGRLKKASNVRTFARLFAKKDYEGLLRFDLTLRKRFDKFVKKTTDDFFYYGKCLSEHIIEDITVPLKEIKAKNGRVVFEGAQGTLLDVDHGTTPFVTSSNTTIGGVFTGTGCSPNVLVDMEQSRNAEEIVGFLKDNMGFSDLDEKLHVTGLFNLIDETKVKTGRIVGVVKAYTTRVGKGPFPTELVDEDKITNEFIQRILENEGITREDYDAIKNSDPFKFKEINQRNIRRFKLEGLEEKILEFTLEQIEAHANGTKFNILLSRIVGVGENAKRNYGYILGKYLTIKGTEFGASTGRVRRCGWLDAVALRYAIDRNGCTDLAVTKLDVLYGLKNVQICVGYKYVGQEKTYHGRKLVVAEKSGRRNLPKHDRVMYDNLRKATGKKYDVAEDGKIRRGDIIIDFPKNTELLDNCVPVYLTMKGINDEESKEAYFGKIEQLTRVKVSIVSDGPKRSQTFFRKTTQIQ